MPDTLQKIPQFVMLINYLLQLVQAVDCFKLNTSISYSTQRYNVHFYATPSKELAGDEKKLCETVIQGENYDLYINLGKVQFVKTGLKYDKDSQIVTTAYCPGNLSDCAYDKIKSVQTATYTLIFNDIDLQITSIVNYYQIRIYYHVSCINSANLMYNGVKQTFQIQVENPVINCPCNFISPPPTGIKDNVFMISKLDGTAVVSDSYNDQTYGSIFKFKQNSSSQLSTKPSSNDQFWKEIVQIGPYNQSNFMAVGALLSVIRMTPVLQLAMRIQLLTEIEQVRNLQSMPTKKLYYRQSIDYSIAQLTNLNQADCFSSIEVELHKYFFYVQSTKNPNPQNCSRSHIEKMIGKPYDAINMQIIVSQNLDKSGFNYYVQHPLPDFQLGDALVGRFYCESDQDCEDLQKIAQFQRQERNVSVSIKLLFMDGKNIQFAISYLANFKLSEYNKTTVSLLAYRICLNVEPVKTGSQVINLYVFNYTFDLTQYLEVEITSYCTELTAEQQQDVLNIIPEMHQNTDMTNYIRLRIDNQIVGDLDVTVYRIPETNFVVWIVTIVLGLIGVASGAGISIKYYKKLGLWTDIDQEIVQS